MNRKIALHFFFLFQLFFVHIALANPLPITVTGKVLANGRGVAGVPVTDGHSIVHTDRRGKFVLQTNSDHRFVYYTLPSGYNSPVVDGVPVFYAPIQPGKKKQSIEFRIFPAGHSQQEHAFVVWADPQVLDTGELSQLKYVVRDVKQTVDSLRSIYPVHALSCGDIVFDRLQLFGPYKNIISTIGVPFYQSIGNHDMDYNGRTDEGSTNTYASQFGPAYYSFNVGAIHYVTLKTVFYYGDSYQYIGYINEDQLSWLEKDLALVKKGSTVVVTVHIPTKYGDSKTASDLTQMRNSVMNQDALYLILSPFNTHILAGHSHTQWNTAISPNLLEHVHAAASGAWWQGDVSIDGSPKGYTVYLAKGDSLSWYFKGVNASAAEQLKVYPAGSDSLYPGYIIVNVYNFDPSWKVWWYENGKLIGEMERYWGEDPLAKQMYQPGQNKKHWWLSVGSTHHLFKAKPRDPDASVTVVVKDRFGHVYRKNL